MIKFNKGKIDIDINIKSLSKSAIPLLIEDKIWVKLFNGIEEKEMMDLKTELKTLIDESREVKSKIPYKKDEKKTLIKKILTLSEKINNNELTEGLELLEEYKEELSKVTDELDELIFKSETIPSKVREKNIELLMETIKYAYTDIIETEKNLEDINDELKELRKRLREIIKEKYDYEDNRNEIYKFLHNALGAKAVDKLDHDILD